MSQALHNLAIETSGRVGSVCLGRGDDLLESVQLPPQERHRLDLMAAIDGLCHRHGAAPADLGQVYVSVGPGSFTGLRIAVSTAKVLAQVLGARLVAVPTLEVLAAAVPGPETTATPTPAVTPAPAPGMAGCPAGHLAVGLNTKRDTVYGQVFTWSAGAGLWQPWAAPRVGTLTELLDRAPRPLCLVGDPLPALSAEITGVTVLPAAMAAADCRAVWRLGRGLAAAGRFTPAADLLPLYVREPEAVELWNRRRRDEAGASSGDPSRPPVR